MQLAPGIHLVGSGSLGFDLTDSFDCHVYLLDGGREAALIDAGAGVDVDAILSNVTASGIELERVRFLLLTHAHADHAGGAAAIRERLPHIQVIASSQAALWVRTADDTAISLDMGKQAGFYPSEYQFTSCPVEREVHEGDDIRVGSLTLEVMESPGHCDGHICLRATVDVLSVLFGGDLVFYGGQISLQNIWDCRIPEYAASMQKLAGAGIDTLLPGHLSITMKSGQRHIDAANDLFGRVFVPRAIF
ncbi:MAG: hypothetical protein NVS4B2_32240 [Chloroflexota bacterium]